MTHSHRGYVFAALSALALGGFAPAVAAQPNAGTPPEATGQGQPGGTAQREGIQQMQQARRELQKTNQELAAIREKTLENNPELAKRRDELSALVQETMSEQGHDPDAQIERLEELRKKMQSGDVEASERREILQEAQSQQQQLQQAQQAALQDEEVQQAREAFGEDLIAAMKEEDPRTEELIQKLDKQRRALREMAPNRPGGPSGGQSRGRPAPQPGSRQ